jgi:ribosomal protein S15P/S13E
VIFTPSEQLLNLIKKNITPSEQLLNLIKKYHTIRTAPKSDKKKYLLDLGAVLMLWYFFIRFRSCSDGVILFFFRFRSLFWWCDIFFFRTAPKSDKKNITPSEQLLNLIKKISHHQNSS